MSGRATISDRFDSGADKHARVTNNRLWVDAIIGSQPIATKPDKSAGTKIMDAQVFDNVTTAAVSSTFDSSDYRDLKVYIGMAKSGTPTNLRFIAQFSPDGGVTWFNYAVDQWVDLRYIQSQMPLGECIPLNYPIGSLFRITVQATGTTAVNTYTVTLWVQGIS